MAVVIAVTRERREGESRCAVTPDSLKKLTALGATVIEMPVIRIQPIAASTEIESAMDAIADYDVIVLTSANGVDALAALMAARGMDARSLHPGQVVVAVGPGTAAALAAHGIDLIDEN